MVSFPSLKGIWVSCFQFSPTINIIIQNSCLDYFTSLPTGDPPPASPVCNYSNTALPRWSSQTSTKHVPLLIRLLRPAHTQHRHALASTYPIQVPTASLHQVFSMYLWLCLYISSTWYTFFYKALFHSSKLTGNSNSCLSVPWFFHQEDFWFSSQHLLP